MRWTHFISTMKRASEESGVSSVIDSPRKDCPDVRPSCYATSSGNKTTISDLEEMFLEGHFDQALVMASNFLEDDHNLLRSESSYHSDKGNWIHFTTPLCLGLDIERQDRFICWQHTGRDEAADEISQVAAIALQSWFELYQQEKHQKSHQKFDKGYRFLLPFLDTYTSSAPGIVPRWPMSIDLLTLFIQFLSSPDVDQATEAMVLSAEFLHHIRSLSNNKNATPHTRPYGICLDAVDETCCNELVVYFYTELVPNHCTSAAAVSDLLNVILVSSKTQEALSSVRRHFSANADEHGLPRKDVLQKCLEFCNTDDGNWPHWTQDAFRKSRTILQAKLREVYDRRRGEELDNGGRRIYEGSPTITPLIHRAKSRQFLSDALSNIGRALSQQLQLLQAMIRDRNVNLLTLSQKRQIQMSCLAVCLMLFGWSRYRKYLSKIARLAIVEAVWKPLLEVVQAMKP